MAREKHKHEGEGGHGAARKEEHLGGVEVDAVHVVVVAVVYSVSVLSPDHVHQQEADKERPVDQSDFNDAQHEGFVYALCVLVEGKGSPLDLVQVTEDIVENAELHLCYSAV